MPVAFLFETPDGNQERYDAVRARLGIDDDNPPPGGIVHIAGPSPNGGWRVIEVWETEEDQQRFARETLEPMLQEAGVQRGAPEKWQVHRMMAR